MSFSSLVIDLVISTLRKIVYHIINKMKHSESEIFIDMQRVSKQYPIFSLFPPKRSYKQALKEINLELEKGKVTCILGPNGAGKTTMLKIIANLVLPDSGKIQRQQNIKSGIGFVTPNERSFYWRLSGRENLRFFASLSHINGKEQKKRVEAVIEETGISEYADTPYRQYSTGIKQRLNIARALLSNPSLILLDEPTTHLDPLAKAEFWDFINKQIIKERNSTVLLATHDLEEATILADKVAILHSGNIVARGTIKNLQRQMNEDEKIVLKYEMSAHIDSIQYIIEKSNIECSIDDQFITLSSRDNDSIHKIILELAGRGYTPYSIDRQTPSLLSIISHHTGRLPNKSGGFE